MTSWKVIRWINRKNQGFNFSQILKPRRRNRRINTDIWYGAYDVYKQLLVSDFWLKMTVYIYFLYFKCTILNVTSSWFFQVSVFESILRVFFYLRVFASISTCASDVYTLSFCMLSPFSVLFLIVNIQNRTCSTALDYEKKLTYCQKPPRKGWRKIVFKLCFKVQFVLKKGK